MKKIPSFFLAFALTALRSSTARQEAPTTTMRAGLFIALAAACAWFVMQVMGVIEAPDFADFNTVFEAAQAIAQHRDPYDVQGLLATPFASHYKYPPFPAVALGPLLSFGGATLAWMFVGLSLLLYGVTFWLMVTMLEFPWLSPRAIILAIAFLVWQPSIDTLAGAQQEFLLLFLFTLSCWAISRARPLAWLAGAAIAGCAIIKVYPVLMTVDFAMKRRVKAVLGFVAAIALFTLISIGRSGLALQDEFWLHVFPILKGGTGTDENQGLLGFFDRFYVNGVTVDGTLLTSAPVATLLYDVSCAVIVAVSFGALWRTAAPRDAFKILIPAMLMMAPASWTHYQELMLLPFALLLQDYREDKPSYFLLPLVVAFVFVAFGNEVTMMDFPGRLLHSYKCYGLIIFWLLGVATTLRAEGSKEAVLF